VIVVPQDGDNWHFRCVGFRQEMTQPLNVGGIAKADVGDDRSYGVPSGLLVVQPDYSTRVMAADRRANSRLRSGRSEIKRIARSLNIVAAQDLPMAFRSRPEIISIMDRNLPIFGKSLIVTATGFAPTEQGFDATQLRIQNLQVSTSRRPITPLHLWGIGGHYRSQPPRPPVIRNRH
jgi:hypothetical protein